MQDTPPTYLLAGGQRGRKSALHPLLHRVFSLSATPRPRIAYVGTASGDAPDFFAWLASLFVEAGAGDVRLAPLAGGGADPATARKILAESDVVFVSGGDVEAGMAGLAAHDMAAHLRRLHRAGKPFFGLSAGSIMLARDWVRWSDPEDDASAELFPCLALAPVYCDTHGEADDWAELQALVRLLPAGEVGYGIPTGGALCVHPDGRVEALGEPVCRYVSHGDSIEQMDDLRLLPACTAH